MSVINFEGGMAELQQRLALSNEGVARRKASFNVMGIRAGHHVLEVGCGGGYFVKELALAVGYTGKVVALDSSSTQIDTCRKTCEGLENIEYLTCSATQMPLKSASFDSVVSIQTLEYIPDVDAVLQECQRVLKPGGMFVSVSVMWDHFKCHGPNERVNSKVLEVWRGHCVYQNLPVEMPSKLAALSFVGVQQTPLAFYLNSFHANSFANYAIKFLRGFAEKSGKFSDSELQEWDTTLERALAENRAAFCSFPVLTHATLS